MSERKKARITVIKKMANMKTRELHLKGFDPENPHTKPCGFLKDGQEWVVGSQAPSDFCHWAWADIHADIVMIQCGGNPGYIGPDNTMISSCCDGFNPVVFRIERLEEPC
ncbi:TIGR04076 family protein [Candidatus Bipolaricaulota bacterium]